MNLAYQDMNLLEGCLGAIAKNLIPFFPRVQISNEKLRDLSMTWILDEEEREFQMRMLKSIDKVISDVI